ncbi:MAG: tRNA 2-thiouridine(34) synthase MnmA [Candidatus Paceibacterota bacterium]|jgi:tRNA-specific 2-thiouridylase
MKKVFVGMSGGVDSSVSAALLKAQGYAVTGVFIKVWQPDFIECTWKEDRLDAMRVASVLDIPFVTLDLEKEYKEGVIDYMIDEYKHGRTPNPDVMCNREVKFGAFLKWAKENGADFIATGHYAQIENNQLKKGRDSNKDQTYFLWTLTKEQIKNVIFPVGNIVKDEVRELACKYNLPVSNKKDSQGLCFVGTIDIKTLLKNYIEEKEGEVKNENGEVIGTHSGVMFYTIGERHGFKITKKTINDEPYFIVRKDFETNTLFVSHTPPREEKGDVISLEKTNWTQKINIGEVYEARARYRAPLSTVEVVDETHFKVIEGELVSTVGQSLVLYDKNICIGGGVIS